MALRRTNEDKRREIAVLPVPYGVHEMDDGHAIVRYRDPASGSEFAAMRFVIAVNPHPRLPVVTPP